MLACTTWACREGARPGKGHGWMHHGGWCWGGGSTGAEGRSCTGQHQLWHNTRSKQPKAVLEKPQIFPMWQTPKFPAHKKLFALLSTAPGFAHPQTSTGESSLADLSSEQSTEAPNKHWATFRHGRRIRIRHKNCILPVMDSTSPVPPCSFSTNTCPFFFYIYIYM